MVKKGDSTLTERQYKTLRRLIFLWFAVLVRRRYKIFQNVLLIMSLAINGIYFFIKQTPVINIIERNIDFKTALDLSKYNSITNINQTLKKRYDKLHSRYLDDKSTPDSSHYNKNRLVNQEWASHCKLQLRRIISIKSRVKMIENLLQTSYPDKEDQIYTAIQEAHYDEVLADMSNYYARFVSSYEYDYIVKTFD